MSVNWWRVLRISGLFLVPALAVFLSVVFLREARSAHWRYERDAQNAADQYAHEADIDAKSRCGLLPRQEQPNCRDRIYRRAHEQSRQEYDLAAQQQAAIWNAAMGEAALIGLPLGVFTLLLIFFTYSEQREANWHARRSSEKSLLAARDAAAAATRQVEIAQDTAYRDLRAYLSIDVTSEPAMDEILAGHVVVKNAGKTPAQVRVFVMTAINDLIPEDFAKIGPEPMRDPQHPPYINVGRQERIQWFFPDDESDGATAIKELCDPDTDRVLFIYGRVEFEDFMRRERVLHFCYRKNGTVRIGHPIELIATPFGNDYEDRSKPA